MGVYICADTPGAGIGTRVGTNGSQVILTGYLFAAYAALRRPESNRVCAWVGAGWDRCSWDWDAPRPERNRPKTVEALIAYSRDEDGDGVAECGFCFAQNDVIELGLKLRPVTDPMLADLVALWQAAFTPGGGRLDATATVRLAGHLPALLEPLQASESWYPELVAVAEVIAAAAAIGAGLEIG